jgi:hypothetical protein
MPTAEAVQRSLAGAWAVMRGRKQGMALLDISADGFWDSFWAIPLALPPLLLAWASAADSFMLPDGGPSRLSVILRLALVDVVNWILPLVLLGLAAERLGLSKRYAAYVVASNWGTLIVVWLGLPIILLSILSPDAGDVITLLGFALFLVSLLFSWRLTQVSLQRDPGTTTAVFVGMALLSVMLVIILQPMLGLTPPA